MKKVSQILVICLAFLMSSCVKDLDFDQLDDLELRPSILAPLIKIDVEVPDIVVGTVENRALSYRSDFKVLENETGQDKLKKVVIEYQASNGFNRKMTLKLDFLDENETPTADSIDISIDANMEGFEDEMRVVIANNPNFINTKYVDVKVTIAPSADGSLLNALDNNKFTFKSAVIAYLDFKK